MVGKDELGNLDGGERGNMLSFMFGHLALEGGRVGTIDEEGPFCVIGGDGAIGDEMIG